MPSPALTEDDVLHIVQSFAQVFRGGGGGPVREASLFLPVRTLEGFTPEQIEDTALAALRFFDLDPVAEDGAALERRLRSAAALSDWARILHAAWKGGHVCFYSSGSTGEPVPHRYAMPTLADEADVLAAFFRSRGRIVSVMPVHHIFGFMHSVWLAKWLGVPVIHAPPLPLAGFFTLLRRGDVIMGFPFFWQSLLTVVRQEGRGAALRFPPDVTGVTATGPCPPWVIAGLREPLGDAGAPLAAMLEIYGSTETNGLGIREGGTEWYELYANWETAVLPGGEKGIRRLRKGRATGEPMTLPDVVTWHPSEDRLFRPERRTDKAVQVGGINVYPERVAARIRTHPLVRDCAVRLMRPEEGSRLKVFIVPECPLDEAAEHFGRPFRAWLAENLDTAGRPKRVRIGTSLPVNAMGKPCDWD
ncbi:MAG: AMP-binding protein [Deltaproteobacteria bacterium]|nr:AMP-binding protein [Deltaproteobacteria bacterium]